MSIRFFKAIWLVPWLVLAGCAGTTQETLVAPNGAQYFLARCSQSPADCIQKAANTCGGTYRVIDNYSRAGGLYNDAIPGPVVWYYLAYQCGPSDGQAPTFPFRGQTYTPNAVVVI